MFIEREKIDQVEEFKVNSELVVCKGTGNGRRNRVLFIFNDSRIEKLAEGVSGFQIKGNHIYYSNWDNESFKFDFENKSLLTLEFDQISIYKLNDFIFFNKEDKYHILAIEEVVISKSALGYNNLLIDFNIFSTNSSNDKIRSYNISFGEKLNWMIGLSHFDTFTNHWNEEKDVEISQLLGVWNNQLITLLTNGTFIGLNVDNGEIQWQKNNVDLNETSQEISYGFGSPYHPFLDEHAGVIYILQGDTFIKFDVEKLSASYEWSSKDLDNENYLFIKNSRKKDDLIYFTASLHPSSTKVNQVGVFDIKLKKVLWKYEFPLNDNVNIPAGQDKIQVDKKNFYVLDSKGTLHIFEKSL